MTERLEATLADWILGQADDQMILAHRNSEWTGHAPILEEDIAFANIALDEMGHAQLLYQLHARLLREDPESYPDQLVFHRQAPAYRNVQMVELPNEDWAFSILRQYLFDVWESVLLPALQTSENQGLAEAAGVMLNEEKYHLHHTQTWVLRLGLGTEESNRRMQQALNALWRHRRQLFQLSEGRKELVEAGWIPDLAGLSTNWHDIVLAQLEAADLSVPEEQDLPVPPRSQHSEQLMDLLGEMQMVARTFPGEEW